jgi:hypothetical protein
MAFCCFLVQSLVAIQIAASHFAFSARTHHRVPSFVFFTFSPGALLFLGGYDLTLAGPGAEWYYVPLHRLPGYGEYTYWAFAMDKVMAQWADGGTVGEIRTRKSAPLCENPGAVQHVADR